MKRTGSRSGVRSRPEEASSRPTSETVRIERDRGSLDAAHFWKKTRSRHALWSWAGVVGIAIGSILVSFALGFGAVYTYYRMR